MRGKVKRKLDIKKDRKRAMLVQIISVVSALIATVYLFFL